MTTPLRVIYMGTPEFAVPGLEHLIDGPHEVVAVYTQPPRPKGRGKQVQPSPVHEVADQYKIPVYTPASLRKNEEAQARFVALDADVAVVVAYGQILPKVLLDAPKFGCLNIHASLLPRWRGAAPIQYAIWKGDEASGITIMQMDEGLDTGPVVEKRAVPIRATTTAQSLHDELAALAAAMIAPCLDKIAENGAPDVTPQNDDKATYAPMLKKSDGHIDWLKPADEIDRQVRALNPWPGTWTQKADDKRIKILEVELMPEEYAAPPGTLIDTLGHVSCGHDTSLRLLKVQPADSRPMDVVSAVNGGYLTVDDLLF